MGWADHAIAGLARGETVTLYPRGGSMRGRVRDGAKVVLEPVVGPLAVEDIVLVKVAGTIYLHRVVERDGARVLIGNNVGGINGWASVAQVFGVAVEVDGRRLLRSPAVTVSVATHGGDGDRDTSDVPLIDVGLNLTHRQFDRDRDAVLARAKAAGVVTSVLTGTTAANSRQSVRLAEQHPGLLYATAGVHPHHAKDWTDATGDHIAELARRPAMVAVGECGLDFDRSYSPHDAQERAMVAQLELAARLSKPVFLHERRAFERFSAIMSEHRPSLVDGVVHCFTGTGEELDRWLELGLHIGITGWICDERRGKHLLELVRRVPLDRLMIETDAPFLLPRNMPAPPSDRRNEPSFLPHVLEVVARALDRPAAEVARATTATARRFFRLG